MPDISTETQSLYLKGTYFLWVLTFDIFADWPKKRKTLYLPTLSIIQCSSIAH